MGPLPCESAAHTGSVIELENEIVAAKPAHPGGCLAHRGLLESDPRPFLVQMPGCPADEPGRRPCRAARTLLSKRCTEAGVARGVSNSQGSPLATPTSLEHRRVCGTGEGTGGEGEGSPAVSSTPVRAGGGPGGPGGRARRPGRAPMAGGMGRESWKHRWLWALESWLGTEPPGARVTAAAQGPGRDLFRR